jgi:hypothetical protein
VAKIDLGECPELPKRFKELLSNSEQASEQTPNDGFEKEEVKGTSIVGTLITKMVSPSKTLRSVPPSPSKTRDSLLSTPKPVGKSTFEASTPMGRRIFYTGEALGESPRSALPTINENLLASVPTSPEAPIPVNNGVKLTVANLRWHNRHASAQHTIKPSKSTSERSSIEISSELINLLDPNLSSFTGSIGERCVRLLGLESDGHAPTVEAAERLERYLSPIILKWKRAESKQNICHMIGHPKIRRDWKQVQYAPRARIIEQSKKTSSGNTTLNEDSKALIHTDMEFILKWGTFVGMPPDAKSFGKKILSKDNGKDKGELYRDYGGPDSLSEGSIEKTVGRLLQGLFYSESQDLVEIE